MHHCLVLENTDTFCEDFKGATDNLKQQEWHSLDIPKENMFKEYDWLLVYEHTNLRRLIYSN